MNPEPAVEITPAVEDYLKALHNLTHPPGGGAEPVSTSALAERLGISAPSVSAMLARLENAGLVRRHRPRGVTLTRRGNTAALRVVRRHRLLETLLHRQLGVPWHELHEEAERLEHAVSERLESYIDRALGYPTHDPHGDPIPRPATPAERPRLPLAAAPAGSAFLVHRVSDTDPAALRHLGEHGILPGVTLTVVEHAPFAGPTWLMVPGRRSNHPLPAQLAHSVFGELVAPPTPDVTPSPVGPPR